MLGLWVIVALAFATAVPGAAVATPSFATLYVFARGTGGKPAGALVSDASGSLYGTTVGGGDTSCRCGTVFKLAPPAMKRGDWTKSTLYSFGGNGTNDGARPVAGLIADASGTLYGTTSGSSGAGYGTVFKLTPRKDGTYTESVLYTFGSGRITDGAVPYAPLVMGSAGVLYGTTTEGGAFAGGTVFKLTPASGGAYTERLLHSFVLNGKGGSDPRAGLVMDSKGTLYGIAQSGATSAKCGFLACGTVFKLTPATGGTYTESTLHTFTGGGTDGFEPIGGLIMDSRGALYGTTPLGGSLNCPSGCGTVFKLTPGASGTYTERVLYFFKGGRDGNEPFSRLIMDSRGALYGTTYYGGRGKCSAGPRGCGTAFALTPDGGGRYKERVLHSFTGEADGAYPSAALYSPAPGVFFGSTQRGGAFGNGTVFEIKDK